MRTRVNLAATTLLLLAMRAVAGSGDIDPTYGTNGVYYPFTPPPYTVATTSIVSPDGRVLSASMADGQVRFSRVDPDGHADAAFGNQGARTLPVPAGEAYSPSLLASEPDGSTYFWVIVRSGSTGSDALLARLAPDGSLDAGFGQAGWLRFSAGDLHPHIDSVEPLQGGGLAVVVSYSRDYWGCADDLRLLWLRPDGMPDPSFPADGVQLLNHCFSHLDGNASLAELPGGRVVYSSPDGIGYFNHEGRVNLRLPLAPHDLFRAAALTADGNASYVVTDDSTYPRVALARLRNDLSVDPGFGSAGRATVDFSAFAAGRFFWDVAVAVSGGTGQFIFLTAFMYRDGSGVGPDHRTIVARLHQDGTLDTSFGNRGFLQFQGFVNPVSGMQDDGTVLVQTDHYSGAGFVRLLGPPMASPGAIRPRTSASGNFTYTAIQGTVLPITFDRAMGFSGAVSVRYRVASGSAIAGVDFDNVSGELAWADGETAAKVLSVPIAAAPNRGAGDFQVLLEPTGGAALLVPGNLAVTILGASQPPVTPPSTPPSTPPVSTPVEPQPNASHAGAGGFDMMILALLGALLVARIASKGARRRQLTN